MSSSCLSPCAHPVCLSVCLSVCLCSRVAVILASHLASKDRQRCPSLLTPSASLMCSLSVWLPSCCVIDTHTLCHSLPISHSTRHELSVSRHGTHTHTHTHHTHTHAVHTRHGMHVCRLCNSCTGRKPVTMMSLPAGLPLCVFISCLYVCMCHASMSACIVPALAGLPCVTVTQRASLCKKRRGRRACRVSRPCRKRGPRFSV